MISTFDIDVAGRTLCQEARGEPSDGQRAVACVIKNRLNTHRWGKSLSSVCLWRAQFSGWYMPSDPNFSYACGLQDEDPMLLKMKALMWEVMNDPSDMTNGATHYYATSIPAPAWAAGYEFCGQWGHQRFYRDPAIPVPA